MSRGLTEAQRLDPTALFRMGDDLPREDRAAIERYLSLFADPRNQDGRMVCISCGEPVDAFRQAFGLGVAYVWGLAHGEASCSGCGWPARGMHYIKRDDGTEVCELRNLFLPYHPDAITPAGLTALSRDLPADLTAMTEEGR